MHVHCRANFVFYAFSVDIGILLFVKCVNRGRNIIEQNLIIGNLKENRFGEVVCTMKICLPKNMEDDFIHVIRITTDVVKTKVRTLFRLWKVESEYVILFLLMLNKSKLYVFQKQACDRAYIWHFIIYHCLE